MDGSPCGAWRRVWELGILHAGLDQAAGTPSTPICTGCVTN